MTATVTIPFEEAAPFLFDAAQLSAPAAWTIAGVRFDGAAGLELVDVAGLGARRGDAIMAPGPQGEPERRGEIMFLRAPEPADAGLPKASRLANLGDLPVPERAPALEDEATPRVLAMIRDLGLAIKLVRIDFRGGGNRAVVYFWSEQRADFRELVRLITRELRLERVEMRQIGARDEAQYLGGIGVCGRELCCGTWQKSFPQVSIKFAKDQGLSLNPQKLAGACGRLRCCLTFEQANYAEMRQGMPRAGKKIMTDAGEGKVIALNPLRRRYKVLLASGEFLEVQLGDIGGPTSGETLGPDAGGDDETPETPEEVAAAAAFAPSGEYGQVRHTLHEIGKDTGEISAVATGAQEGPPNPAGEPREGARPPERGARPGREHHGRREGFRPGSGPRPADRDGGGPPRGGGKKPHRDGGGHQGGGAPHRPDGQRGGPRGGAPQGGGQRPGGPRGGHRGGGPRGGNRGGPGQ